MTLVRYFDGMEKYMNSAFDFAWNYTEQVDANELEVELPGVDRKDVSVTVKERTLTIEALKKGERLYKYFTIPKSTDLERIEASLKNGVLVVKLPKKEEQKGRTIPVG